MTKISALSVATIKWIRLRMKKALWVAVMVGLMFVGAGLAAESDAPEPTLKDSATASCFVCLKCVKVAARACKCCGQDMTPIKIVSIKDGSATCCFCLVDGAKYGEVKAGKCLYSQPVVTCDLTGKFVCEKCGKMSDAPGKCGCRADLVEVKPREIAKQDYVTKGK